MGRVCAYLPMKAMRHTSREVEARVGPEISAIMLGMTKVSGGKLHPLPWKKLTMCWVGLITVSASCRSIRSCHARHRPSEDFANCAEIRRNSPHFSRQKDFWSRLWPVGAVQWFMVY